MGHAPTVVGGLAGVALGLAFNAALWRWLNKPWRTV